MYWFLFLFMKGFFKGIYCFRIFMFVQVLEWLNGFMGVLGRVEKWVVEFYYLICGLEFCSMCVIQEFVRKVEF